MPLSQPCSFSQPEPASDSRHLCCTAGSMPAILQSDEKISPMKNQIVMTPGFLYDKPLLRGQLSRVCADLPIFVIHSMRPGTLHFVSTVEKGPWAFLSA